MLLQERRAPDSPAQVGNAPVPIATKPRGRGRRVVIAVILALVAVLMIAPFLTLAIAAVTSADELRRDAWLPSHVQWHNFIQALTDIPFGTYARNSLVLSTIFAGLSTLTSATVGYGFARLRGPFKGFLFGVLISMMIVPQIVTLIPTYLLFAQVGLVGTYWPWALWGLAGAPYAIFLYRQFFSNFPKELEEAALLDGASRVRIFLQIFLPLSRPLLVTAFVLAFNAVWGDFIAPNLLLSQDNTTLAVGVASGYVTDHGFSETNVLAAGALFYVVPVLLLFLFVQRSYVRGFVSTGLK